MSSLMVCFLWAIIHVIWIWIWMGIPHPPTSSELAHCPLFYSFWLTSAPLFFPMRLAVKILIGIVILLVACFEGVFFYYYPSPVLLPLKYTSATDSKTHYAYTGENLGFPKRKRSSKKSPSQSKWVDASSGGFRGASALVDSFQSVYVDDILRQDMEKEENILSKRKEKKSDRPKTKRSRDDELLEKASIRGRGVPKHLLWAYRKEDDPEALGSPSNPLRGQSDHWKVGNYVHPDHIDVNPNPMYYPWDEAIGISSLLSSLICRLSDNLCKNSWYPFKTIILPHHSRWVCRWTWSQVPFYLLFYYVCLDGRSPVLS